MLIVESAFVIITILFARYGLDKAIASCLSGLTLKPFQMQVILPEFNSNSFVPQSIGCNTSSILSFLVTSFAKSISKPMISLLSPRKPIGGKLSSNPITNCALPVSEALSVWFFLHPKERAESNTVKMINSFFISHLFKFSFLHTLS